MEEAKLAPLSAKDDEDSVAEIKDLGQVEDVHGSCHSRSLGVVIVANKLVIGIDILLSSLVHHVNAQSNL
jgi:hypothetical protein